MEKTAEIYDTVLNVFKYAENEGITPVDASNLLAEKRIEDVGKVKTIYSSKSQFSNREGEMYRR